jgi:hypothetical protein
LLDRRSSKRPTTGNNEAVKDKPPILSQVPSKVDELECKLDSKGAKDTQVKNIQLRIQGGIILDKVKRHDPHENGIENQN